MASDPLRSTSYVANLLGVSIETLYKWNSLKTGPPFIKYGRHVKYRDSAIEAWLRSREVSIDDPSEAIGS